MGEVVKMPHRFGSDLGSEMVDIFVGPGKERFHVHKALLCSRSKYFKGMFLSTFKEGIEQVATLTEEEPFIFNLFIEWVYKDCLSKMDITLSSERSGPFVDRMKLYAYAIKICQLELQDYLMTNLLQNYQYHGKHPSFHAIMMSYEWTPPGSPLRKFMARCLVQLIGTKSSFAVKKTTDDVMANSDLVRDFLEITAEQNDLGILSTITRPWNLPVCDFHLHAEGAECAYKEKL